MATNRIVLPKTVARDMVTEAVGDLYSAINKLERIDAMMGQIVRSAGALVDADFFPLCDELGLDHTVPEQLQRAKDFFYIVPSVLAQVNGTGQNMSSVVPEFMARLDQG